MPPQTVLLNCFWAVLSVRVSAKFCDFGACLTVKPREGGAQSFVSISCPAQVGRMSISIGRNACFLKSVHVALRGLAPRQSGELGHAVWKRV